MQEEEKEQQKKIKIEKKSENGSDLVLSPIPEDEKPVKLTFLDILAKLAPGKSLRIAADDILRGKMGALIVIDCPELKNIFEGGFRVNCKFSPQKLAELAKMDGAIILSDDMKRILFANTLLVPDFRISTNETGTRHKAAERTSKQIGVPVIAVSERRERITLFHENKRYVLPDSENLLRRATENLHVLEKQREIFDDILTNLNILETTNLVSVGDVCSVIQRMEMIMRVMSTLKRYVIELGNDGIIIQMRIREVFRGIEDIEAMILRDYSNKPAATKKILSSINFDSLLDVETLARTIFESSGDKQIFSRGYRVLSKLGLTEREIKYLINRFNNLGNILNAAEADLQQVLKTRTNTFKKELENLKEKIMMGKKV